MDLQIGSGFRVPGFRVRFLVPGSVRGSRFGVQVNVLRCGLLCRRGVDVRPRTADPEPMNLEPNPETRNRTWNPGTWHQEPDLTKFEPDGESHTPPAGV